MYRLLVESLLGLRLEAGKLHFAPVLPEDWDGYTLAYRHHSTLYRIELVQTDAGHPALVILDGIIQPDGSVPLVDDGTEHEVELTWPRSG
jgi:cellobiose phosphorylase